MMSLVERGVETRVSRINGSMNPGLGSPSRSAGWTVTVVTTDSLSAV